MTKRRKTKGRSDSCEQLDLSNETAAPVSDETSSARLESECGWSSCDQHGELLGVQHRDSELLCLREL